MVQHVTPKRRIKLIILHDVITTGCFFSCLSDKHRPIASPDTLPSLLCTPRVGEV